MPEANRFVLHIMAAVAEQEGRAISERTKAALAAANARGVKLGWSNPERASEQRQAAKKGAAVNRARAFTHAENVLPVIEQIRAGGASLRQIAAELNGRGIKTVRGGKWYATTVRNILTAENEAESCAFPTPQPPT
jgi:DNA invertase Pin-like site-specific DNA recombinase